MKEDMKSFNLIESVVDSACEGKFSRDKINRDKYSKLKSYCDQIDEINSDGKVSICRADIDKSSGRISVTAMVNDILFDVGDNDAKDLFRGADMISYWVSPNKKLYSQFIFPSIWDE